VSHGTINGKHHRDDAYDGDHTLGPLPSEPARPQGRQGRCRESRVNRESGEDRDNREGSKPTAPLQSYPLSSPLSLLSLQRAFDETLPARKSDRRRKLFLFCRHLKAHPKLATATIPELRPIIEDWHARMVAKIGAIDLTDTLVAFMAAWSKVRVPAGASPVDLALAAARKGKPPAKAAAIFTEEPILLLASICRELQRLAGDGPFYLDSRTAGKLIGVDHGTAWRLLRVVFCRADVGLLKAGEAGNRKKSNRCFYLGD
jgi:hypothetical protein